MPTSPASDRRQSEARDRRGGFSLAEVVLALALLALLATLSLPFFRPQSGQAAVHRKAFEIVALLRADRNASLRNSTEYAISVDAKAGTVRSRQSRGSVTLPSTMKLRLFPANISGFVFHPDGSATGGRLSILAGSNSAEIGVDDMTAAILIRDGRRDRN